MMTVGQLIEELQKIDSTRIVILSKDEEGNGYSPLASLWTGAYKAENSYSGEVGLERITNADRKAGYTDGDVMRDGISAVVLTPAN